MITALLRLGQSRHSRDDAVFAVLAPAAVGEVISGLESLTTLEQYGSKGLLRGRLSGRDDSRLPLPVRRRLDSLEGAAALKALSVIGGVLVLTGRGSRRRQILGSAAMLASSSLMEYRNSFGRDGSDQMNEVINAYRLVTALIPEKRAGDELFLRAVNAQTWISYVASGLAKAVSSTWRAGDALDEILDTQQYGGTHAARLLKPHKRLMRAMSWFTIVWETFFPVVYLLGPNPARLSLWGVKLFHAGIAAVMGLPRFFWGFSAAHGAVDYVIRERARQR